MKKIDRIIELLESIDQKLSIGCFSSNACSPKKTRKRAAQKPVQVTPAVWEIYEQEFEARWKVKPNRNAMINGMISQIVKRIAQEDLQDLVELFIRQNDSWYLREMHHPRCLLKDCEMLLTRMKSKMVMTESKARQIENLGSNMNEAMEYLKVKHGDKNGS